MAHVFAHFSTDNVPAYHYSRCKCGFATTRSTNKQEVEDQERAHHDSIKRVLAHLHKSQPSLAKVRDHYAEMAKSPDVSPHDRVMWQRLHDELDHRLNDDSTRQTPQEPLPFE